MRQEYFAQGFDTFEPIFKLERELAAKLRSVLSISAKVEVKQPGTLERSQGKSKFVIDKRVLK